MTRLMLASLANWLPQLVPSSAVSITQGTSSIGRPPIPPSSALAYATAASMPMVASGKNDSWLTYPILIGSPDASLAVPPV